MEWKYNDGGRKDTGYKGETSDCVCRSIAIATGMPYQNIYDSLNIIAENERPRGKKKRSHARTGVYKQTIKKYLEGLGWTWTPTMQVGSGCKVHLCAEELPDGVLIVSVSKHLTTVINGVIHDTHDCSRGEKRCVYGYWKKSDV